MTEIHLPGHRGVGLSTLLQLLITHTFMVRPPPQCILFQVHAIEMALFSRYNNRQCGSTVSDAPLCSNVVSSGSTSAAKRYMHNSGFGTSPSVTLLVQVVRI
jgi:hypothetical protein